MRKIPTLFVRDPEDRSRVLPVVNPACAWVAEGEGVPTRKYDGTCVRLDEDGRWWARREVKPGKQPPPGFLAVERDEVTGKTVGWEPVEQSSFAKFHAEALAGWAGGPGGYELIGPKVNGNPDASATHQLVRHGWASPAVGEDVATAPRDFDGLREWLTDRAYEGLVFHHPDGRMAKIKARDFRG
ncbi:hypothetical protein [Kitasatospora sp. McL0602]|uniref:hypothetical protein n=1 Tax=Kitasatospora sp. McL0602 TaxID=3439530 RepID=UPI003F88C962